MGRKLVRMVMYWHNRIIEEKGRHLEHFKLDGRDGGPGMHSIGNP